MLLFDCACVLRAPFLTKSATLPYLLLTRHSLETQFKINEPECHGCGVIKLPGIEEIAFHKHPELLWLFFFLKCLIQ